MKYRNLTTIPFLMVLMFAQIANVRSQTLLDSDSTILEAPSFRELRIDPSLVEADSNHVRLDSITYVYLETTKQSEFSIISHLGVTKNEYIIFDSNLDAIFIFYKDGRFKKKLSAPKDFKHAVDFRINEYEQAIYVDDIDDMVIHKFDFDGNKVGQMKKTEWAGQFDFQEKLRINYYNFYSPVISPDGSKHANLTMNNHFGEANTQGYLWYDSLIHDSINLYGNNCFFKSNGNLLLARELDNTIYGIENDRIIKRWKIVLPMEYSVPVDFLTNPIYKNQHIDYIGKRTNIFHKLNDVYETSDFLTFSYRQGITYMYDKELDLMHDLAYIGRNDFKKRRLINGPGFSVLAVDGEHFITSLPAVVVKSKINKLSKDERLTVDKKLLELSEKSYFNPVLVLLHIKK